MPLEPATETTTFTDPGTLDVVFSMKNLMVDQRVKVFVAAEAIQKLGGSGNPKDVFDAHRTALERIASTKFDRQGGGTEVAVRAEDVP